MKTIIYQFPQTERTPEEVFFNTDVSSISYVLEQGYNIHNDMALRGYQKELKLRSKDIEGRVN